VRRLMVCAGLAVAVWCAPLRAGIIWELESFNKSGSLGGPPTWNWGWTEDNVDNGDVSNTSTSYDFLTIPDGTNGAFKCKSSTGGFAVIYVQFAVTPGLPYQMWGRYMSGSIDSSGDISFLLKDGAYVSGVDNQAANMTPLPLNGDVWSSFTTGPVVPTHSVMTVVLRGGSTTPGVQGFFDVLTFIPEPATLMLVAGGLLLVRRRR
jgi:hypothetical protein